MKGQLQQNLPQTAIGVTKQMFGSKDVSIAALIAKKTAASSSWFCFGSIFLSCPPRIRVTARPSRLTTAIISKTAETPNLPLKADRMNTH
jgi:hypothetical protein